MNGLQNAFRALGVHNTKPSQPAEWCAEGAVLLLAETTCVDGGDPERDDFVFTAGLFLLIFCDHFSRLHGADKEKCVSIALPVILPLKNSKDDVEAIVGFHNDLAETAPKVLNIIGNCCANWVGEPNAKNIAILREVFIEIIEGFATS